MTAVARPKEVRSNHLALMEMLQLVQLVEVEEEEVALTLVK
jgi:hypothetical protein